MVLCQLSRKVAGTCIGAMLAPISVVHVHSMKTTNVYLNAQKLFLCDLSLPQKRVTTDHMSSGKIIIHMWAMLAVLGLANPCETGLQRRSGLGETEKSRSQFGIPDYTLAELRKKLKNQFLEKFRE